MMKLWQKLGVTVFWLSWPLLYWYLRGSRRTRVLLVHNDNVLVTKSWVGDGKWSLPGGGLHHGESGADGALRELHEETGITIEKEQLIPLHSAVYQAHGLGFAYECFVVEFKEMPPVPKLRSETVAAQWINWRELSAGNAGPDTIRAVTAWFEGAKLVE